MLIYIVNAALGLIELHDLLFLWQLRAYKDLVLLGLTFTVCTRQINISKCVDYACVWC